MNQPGRCSASASTASWGRSSAGWRLDDLISTDPGRVDSERERLRKRLVEGAGQGGLKEVADKQYGIEVIDVRLRRINHPPAAREAIFERIRSERARRAAEYESEGERRSLDIASESKRKVTQLEAEGRAEAIRITGAASARADRIRNEASRLDPQFYTFLKQLEDYQRILGDNKTLLLLSTHRALFDTLFNPPTPGKKPAEMGKQ